MLENHNENCCRSSVYCLSKFFGIIAAWDCISNGKEIVLSNAELGMQLWGSCPVNFTEAQMSGLWKCSFVPMDKRLNIIKAFLDYKRFASSNDHKASLVRIQRP